MSRTEYLRQTYDGYFTRLEKVAAHLKELKILASKLRGEEKVELEAHIRKVETELASYAKHLSSSGIDVIKNVA